MIQLRSLRLVGATGIIRTAIYNEREHLVVPVVAMVEGVVWAVNSDVPEFVPAEELAQTPHQWNGRGCFAGHPKDGDSQVTANTPRTLETSFGLIFDTVNSERILETRSLEFNTWLDPVKAEAVGPEAADVIRRLRAGERVEVSIGTFVDVLEEDGEFDGRAYHGRWTDLVSDHIAFIAEGDLGACSIADGCGAPRMVNAVRHAIERQKIDITTQNDRTKHFRDVVRIARVREESAMPAPTTQSPGPAPSTTTGPAPSTSPGPATSTPPATPPNRSRSLRERFAAMLGMRAAAVGVTNNDLHYALDSALRAVEPGYQGIDEVFPDGSDQFAPTHVIYYVMPGETWTCKRRSYTPLSDGSVTLTDDAIEVQYESIYVPVTAPTAAAQRSAGVRAEIINADGTRTPTTLQHAPCSCGGQARHSEQPPTTEETSTMNKAERIAALMAAGSKSPIKSKPVLELCSDAELTELEKVNALPAAASTTATTEVPASAAQSATTVVPAPATAGAAAPAVTLSTEDWIKMAPPEARQMFEDKRLADAARHAELVDVLKTTQTAYTEDELKALSLREIKKVAAVANVDHPLALVGAGVQTDFSGRGMPRSGAQRAATATKKDEFAPPDPYKRDLESRKAQTH